MIDHKVIEDAWLIRHEAALRHGGAASSFDWPSCVGMAMKGEKVEKLDRVYIKTTQAGIEVCVEEGLLCVGEKVFRQEINETPADIQYKYPGQTHRSGGLLMTTVEAETAKAAIKRQTEAKKQAEIKADREKESTCKKMLVLIRADWGLLTEEIATVYILPEEEQKEYIKELQGSMVRKSIDSDTKKVVINDSETAQKITAKDTSGYQFRGESMMWIITPEDEAAIIAEMAETKKNKEAAAAKVKKEYEETHVEEIAIQKATAKRDEEQGAKGLASCWECGCYVPFRQLDESGYCGC